MNKVKGYTMVEMMVVLLISSLLLTAGSVMYLNVTKYHHRLKDRMDKTNAFFRLQYHLQRDHQKMRTFSLDGDQLSFGEGSVLYSFGTDTTFREDINGTDYFLIGGACDELEKQVNVTLNLYDQKITLPLHSTLSFRQIWNNQQ